MKRHGGQTRTRRAGRGVKALLLAACVASGLLCVAGQQPARPGAATSRAAGQPQQARPRYRIELKLDFDARAFQGTERVRWVNRDSRPSSVLYFHLYANHRPQAEEAARAQPTAANGANGAAQADAPDEPRVEVTQVRSAAGEQPLAFSTDEQGVTLRVQLREPVPPGGATEVLIAFKGNVPEIDADETSLSAHVVQQVGAALRDTREWRRARDTNFTSRGVMLLGAFHPVLAARTGDDWQRRVEPGVGRITHTETADYEVTVEAPSDVTLFTSGQPTTARGAQAGGDAPEDGARVFAGESLRGFAFVAGRGLRVAEQVSAGVRVRSVYAAEHERVGRRVLGVAAEAVRVFVSRFGAPPYKSFTVAEAPLVAGLGNVEFSGLGVVASAFYVDFDAPSTRNLPPLVREQRASVEDSLEFTVAHLAAHQWWGAAVGNDPERAPVLDEALAHWSALLYYQDTYGAERAAQASDDQLKGVYQIYRTFGGEDLAAGAPARQYRNSFQYAAVVSGKGALMFKALRQQMGEERFWPALRKYYEANRFEVAETRDLQAAFVAEAAVAERRALTRTFDRWLNEKRGDEDIAPPNPELAAALGISVEQRNPKDGNSIVRLGRFFWRQMTRIR